jgi:hypothetical protein
VISEALTGALLGGLLRLAPEALKAIDRRGERAHELRMQELEFRWLKARNAHGNVGLLPSFAPGALDAMRESYIQDQAAAAAKRWPVVAALAALVRPTVTWALLALYVAIRLAAQQTYGEADIELLSSVLAFWFLGRVWERKR